MRADLSRPPAGGESDLRVVAGEHYLVSLWRWCFRQRLQNFESSSFSALALLFLVVL
jgi:hypothetical protein